MTHSGSIHSNLSQNDDLKKSQTTIHKSILNRINPNETDSEKNPRTKKYHIEYPFKSITRKTDQISPLFNFIKLTLLFIINIAFFFPIALFLVITVYIPFKFLKQYLFKLLHCLHLTESSRFDSLQIPQFLNPIELFWLFNSNLNKQTNCLVGSKSIGACLFFIEGYLAKNTIRDLINNRIIQVSTRSQTNEFSRFTERLLKVFGFGYVWVQAHDFNLDEHIIEIDTTKINLKNDQDLQAYISNNILNEQNFSLNKPLWSLYYIKSYGQNLSDRTTVLIFLYHESFSSGISLMRLFLKGLVDNRNALDLKPRFAYFNFNLSLIKQMIFSWLNIFVFLLFKKKDQNPLNWKYFRSDRFKMLNLKPNLNENNNNNNRQILTWSEPFSLVMLNRLKMVTRSKMNDLLISTLAGILRNYLQIKGINNPLDMKMLMPIDLTSNKYPFKIKNNSTLVSIRMPLNTEGAIPRLWMTKIKTSKLKKSNNFLFLHFLINCLFYLLPNRLAYRLVENALGKNTFLASTLGAGDSSLSTLSLCNRNVKGLIYFNPSISNVKINFAIVTYGDEVRLSLQADSNVISNPELITNEFIKQLENLTDLLANRRIPGEVRRAVRPIFEAHSEPLPGILYNSGEVAIEEMQQKMAEIQQELQTLSESLINLDQTSCDYLKQKQIILIKSDRLRKEFRSILAQLQIRQNINSQAIPSDDEDELDPNERIRLRSSSIVSKLSLGSNSASKRTRESSSEHSNVNIEKTASSRKGSNSRKGSLSFASGVSNELSVPNGHNSTHNINSLSVENELTISKKQVSFHSSSQSSVNKDINNNNTISGKKVNDINDLSQFYDDDF
ncbi:unnamed protein product [Brachionus calyciflorus]|uniref:O-acyltransferase WSD1 C-terminal domain-containing protein n=1 Tax=Brachionus calyciflorus TaxID=104777 RepID=A0A813PHV5_9BILA|nr:unnamed protein product [Brachionus calyciflorus]